MHHLVEIEQADPEYGPVIRHLLPGDSFGELALLQSRSHRTATVIVSSSHGGNDGANTDSDLSPVLSHAEAVGMLDCYAGALGGATAGVGYGVDMIKIPRSVYDHAVTSIQVSQLEGRLNFLLTYKVLLLVTSASNIVLFSYFH